MSSSCRRLHSIFTTPTTATSLTSTTPRKKRQLQKMVDEFKTLSESPEFRACYGNFLTIVRRLTAAKKFSMVEDVLEHQRNFEDITDEQFSVRIISLYGKAHMFDHAQKLFDQMPDLNCTRTVRSFNALLSACIDAGKLDKVEEIFKDFPTRFGITLDVVSFNIVIKAYCEMGSLDSAVLALNEMEKRGLEADLITFNTLLNGFYGTGKFADGENIWRLMASKNVFPNVRSYNSRLRGLVMENKVMEAVDLLKEMESKGTKPDTISYNAVIKGFCDYGNVEEVKKWYRELKDYSYMPDRVTYVTMVPFLCQKGDFDMALELCTDIINRSLPIRPTLFEPVLDGLVKQSRVKEAKNLVELCKSNKQFPYKLSLPTVK